MSAYVDLVVAGGGPTGLAAAIVAARAGMSVVVVEPREGVIDKACGEGILPGGVEGLAALGVEPEGMPIAGVLWADALDPDLRATGTFPRGAARGVRRTTLHAALRDRALALGVRWCVGRVTAIEQRADEVRAGEHRARWLVGADGLRSRVRRALGVELPPRSRPRFGLRQHFAVRPWSDRVEVHFAEGVEAYVTPVASDLVQVAFLFEGRGQSFDALLARFPSLARGLEGRPRASSVRGAGPFEQRVRRRVVGRVLLAGDAAGYVDPITGEGVALGLATASAAVACILEDRPEAYERLHRSITRRSFALTTALLAVARRAPARRALLALARACPWAFDAALGLAGQSPWSPEPQTPLEPGAWSPEPQTPLEPGAWSPEPL